MATRAFFIVDVFAERKYAGNQLAVVAHGEDLDTDTMLAITREMNYSETTFLMSNAARDGAWPVRIFTPGAEVPFAGHPTLGTAWVIRNELLGGRGETVELDLKVGRIPVTFEPATDGPEVLWMRQVPPTFGERMDARDLAELLRVSPDDVDGRHPVQTVSTGLPFWIAPLKTLAAVRRARIDADRYAALAGEHEAKAILLFAPEAVDPGNQIHARMFADALGVPEDPATGSANGCLAAWLVRHRFFGESRIDVRVEQGYEIGRPSLLRLRAEPRGDDIAVRVGGRVFDCARGELI